MRCRARLGGKGHCRGLHFPRRAAAFLAFWASGRAIPFQALKYRRMRDRLRNWARTIKRDVHALYLASRDPRVPWYAKAMGLLVAGYALSPIDLIPDFIPVLGY